MMPILAAGPDGPVIAAMAIGMAPILFLFMLLGNRHKQRHEQELRRLDLMRAALQRNDLPAAQRDALLRELTGKPAEGLGLVLRNPLAAIGWVGIFVGIGVSFIPEQEAPLAGLLIGLISFAVLTLPLALRELARRMP